MSRRAATRLIIVFYFVFCAGVTFAESIEGCKEYSKLGIPSQQGELLCRKGFLLAHNPDNKTPIWVIEHLTTEKASGTLPRYNKFQPDPDLDEGDRAELADYKGSGYDRGHMAPSADMRWDQQAMEECFYLSNMVPQVGKGMNQGIWKNLEELVRDWTVERSELFIFTGPIYKNGVQKIIGKDKVAVPSHLYKIVYDPYKAEALAFLMPNAKLNSADLPKYIVSIRDIEKETGLNFLSNLNPQVQELIETSPATQIWQ